MSPSTLLSNSSQSVWDAFISHASEDKESLVRPLAVALQAAEVTVWYDAFTLTVGDSLRRSIMDFAAQGLSKVKLPRRIDFSASLPREENGKLYKKPLRDRYWSEASTS